MTTTWPGMGTFMLAPQGKRVFMVHELARTAMDRVVRFSSDITWVREQSAELQALLDAPDRRICQHDLIYSATARCVCGAGLCYLKFAHDSHGAWSCSAILIGEAAVGSEHDKAKPFSFWSLKSEKQPSANGLTTRPRVAA